VSNIDVRTKLAAALPAKLVNQKQASTPGLPDVYGWDAVTALPGVSGDSSVTATEVLQSTLKEVSDSVTQANKQLADWLTLQQQLLASTNQNTQALNSNTQGKGSGSNALSAAGGFLDGILGQGSILSPIVSGLLSLFGGSDPASPAVVTAFAMPAPVNVETSINQSVPAAGPAAATPPAVNTTRTVSQQPIQIHVSAMDSKSFLDHSNDIADAVRRALLDSHSLSDVIAEL
jgi:hypothetical protein